MTSSSFNPLIDAPTLVSRFPGYRHPLEKEIEADMKEYCLKMWPWSLASEKERYIFMDDSVCALLSFPNAPYDRAFLATVWYDLNFLVDDVVERMSDGEATELVKRICEVITALINGMEQHPENLCPIGKAFYDIGCRMLAVPDHGLKRMAELAFEDNLFVLQHTGNKLGRRNAFKQGLDAYLKYRYNDGGICLCISVHYFARGIVVPQHMLTDETVHKVLVLVGKHAVLNNDLYSYRKELKAFESFRANHANHNQDDEGFIMFNALSVLCHHFDMTLLEAISEVTRLLGQYEEEYLAAVENLQAKYKDSQENLEEITQMDQSYRDFMGGNVLWSKECKRYNYLEDRYAL